jgi:hypothetical protein
MRIIPEDPMDEVPVENANLPLTPDIPAFVSTVENTTAPDDSWVPSPEDKETWPPVRPPDSAMVVPAAIVTTGTGWVPVKALAGPIECPLMILMLPPFPPVAAPLIKDILPDTPLLVVPVRNANVPLAPLVPAFFEWTKILPEEVMPESPELKVTEPPVVTVPADRPATKITSPPQLFASPLVSAPPVVYTWWPIELSPCISPPKISILPPLPVSV